MRLPRVSTVTSTGLLALIVASGCTARVYEYRGRPTTTVTTTTCDPNYPCHNTYYWDEYREVYVYYDGYRYWDATGMPGAYPVPPTHIDCYGPPPGYVPPSAYRAERGRYKPPRNYRSRGYPPVHDA